MSPAAATDSLVYIARPADVAVWAAMAKDAVAAKAAYSSIVLGDSAIAYLRLAETAGLVAAEVVAGRNGTISATGVTYALPSALGGDPADRSMGFNGTTGKVDIPFAAALNPSPAWSLEAWWFESVGQASNCPVWDCRPASSGALAAGFDLFLNVGTGIGISVCSTNVAQTIITWAPSNLLGVWHHTVATYDGAQVRLFGDGALRSGPTTCPFTPNPNKAVGIAHLTGGSNFVVGSIDEVALYGYALSAAQVANHYLVGTVALGTIATAKEALV